MSHKPNPKSTVLYADDDPDDLELLREAFHCYSKDIRLITCKNGAEAMHYFKSLSPHEDSPCLVILDINMPILSGKEVLQKIRAMSRFKETPVVLFTTSSQREDSSFAKQYDAAFVTKPVAFTQLEKIADQFIEHCADEIKTNLRKQMQ